MLTPQSSVVFGVVEYVFWVFFSRIFEFSKARHGDVEELIKRRNIDLFASEIGNYAKSGDWSMKERAVELGKDICASSVARNENKGTEVASSHLPIKRLFNGGVPHKDKVAQDEFVIFHGFNVVELEASCSLESRFEYFAVEISEVFATFLERYSAISDEVGRRENRVGRG